MGRDRVGLEQVRVGQHGYEVPVLVVADEGPGHEVIQVEGSLVQRRSGVDAADLSALHDVTPELGLTMEARSRQRGAELVRQRRNAWVPSLHKSKPVPLDPAEHDLTVGREVMRPGRVELYRTAAEVLDEAI